MDPKDKKSADRELFEELDPTLAIEEELQRLAEEEDELARKKAKKAEEEEEEALARKAKKKAAEEEDEDEEGLARKAKKKKEEEESEEEEMEESYKAKAQKIFETAVDMKVSAIRESLEEEFEKKVEAISEALESKIDQYCDYVVEQWLQDNQFKVETSLRSEIAENFIAGLKDLFAENYFEVPEEKADLCESLGATVARLKDEKKELLEEIEMANLEILETRKNSIIESVSSDLFESQKAKLKKLAENISASDVQDFEEKLTSIKEVFFSEAVSTRQTKLDEGFQSLNEEQYYGNSDVQGYASFLSRTVKR